MNETVKLINQEVLQENIDITKERLAEKQAIMQYSTMPIPSANNLGKIYQYIGETITAYTSGYFYKCVHNTENDTYSWRSTDTQEVKELSTEQMNTLLSYL